LKDDVRSLNDDYSEVRRDNSSLAEELRTKFEENKFLTKTLKEKLADLRKALTDWLDLNKTNRDLCFEMSKINLNWMLRRSKLSDCRGRLSNGSPWYKS